MKLLVTIFVVIVCQTSWATPQIGDKLRFEDGNEVWTYGLRFPEEIQTRINAWMDLPGNRDFVNTANWQGYYIDISIRDSHLYIDRIFVGERLVNERIVREAPMRKIFGFDSPVKADWFSGDLVEYYGDYRDYTHVRSQMRTYRFEKGMLTDVEQRRTPRNH